MIRVLALLCAVAVSAPAVALADVAPEPCEGAEEGDACETSGGEAGTCEESSGGLTCEAGSGSEADDGCSTSSSSTSTLPGMALVAGAALALFAIKRRKG